MKTTTTTIQKSEIDSKNIENAKIDLSKIQFDFKENGLSGSKTSSKSLYKGLEGLSSDDKKIFRSKIRRTLKNLMKDILGKDRSNEERMEGISQFMIFYKKNWITTDFKIESFTEVKNEMDLKNYKSLLAVVSQALGN